MRLGEAGGTLRRLGTVKEIAGYNKQVCFSLQAQVHAAREGILQSPSMFLGRGPEGAAGMPQVHVSNMYQPQFIHL